MKIISQLLFAMLLMLCIQSCEGYRCSDGVVLDKLTNLPLDSVLCDVISGSQKAYTDSTGKFDVCNRMGGCVPDCKDIMVKFSKAGYRSQQIENPGTGAVIYLEKE